MPGAFTGRRDKPEKGGSGITPIKRRIGDKNEEEEEEEKKPAKPEPKPKKK